MTFNTAYTKACQWTQSWASSIHLPSSERSFHILFPSGLCCTLAPKNNHVWVNCSGYLSLRINELCFENVCSYALIAHSTWGRNHICLSVRPNVSSPKLLGGFSDIWCWDVH